QQTLKNSENHSKDPRIRIRSPSYPRLPHPPQPVVGAGVPSSLPASEGVDLDEYMQFAHIEPTDFVIQQALDDLGITHFSAFRNFKACEL
ncbi:uncharacterized protein VP01_7924g1, partial [Puccinia sorghi]